MVSINIKRFTLIQKLLHMYYLSEVSNDVFDDCVGLIREDLFNVSPNSIFTIEIGIIKDLFAIYKNNVFYYSSLIRLLDPLLYINTIENEWKDLLVDVLKDERRKIRYKGLERLGYWLDSSKVQANKNLIEELVNYMGVNDEAKFVREYALTYINM